MYCDYRSNGPSQLGAVFYLTEFYRRAQVKLIQPIFRVKLEKKHSEILVNKHIWDVKNAQNDVVCDHVVLEESSRLPLNGNPRFWLGFHFCNFFFAKIKLWKHQSFSGSRSCFQFKTDIGLEM